MNIRWTSFDDILKKSEVGLIVKADPAVIDVPKVASPKPIVQKDKAPVVPADNPTSVPNTYSMSTGSKLSKPSKSITLDDIAPKLHRYPRVSKEEFLKMPRQAQDEHLKHNALQNLNEDEHGAIRRIIGEHASRMVRRAEQERMLPHFPHVYDPEKFHSDVVDKLYGLFGPKYQSDYKHQDKNGKLSREKLEAKFAGQKKMPALYYSSGFDSDRDVKGSDIASFLRQQHTYAPRVAEEDKDIGPVIRPMANAIIQARTKQKEHTKAQRQLDEHMKKVGLQTGNFIEMDKPYSLSELEKVAHSQGYDFNTSYNENGDPQSISVAMNDEDGDDHEPAFTVNLAKGEKLSDLKYKLAKLLNPQQTDESHPVKQFARHEEELENSGPKIQSAEQNFNDADQEFKRYDEEPEAHIENIGGYTSKANNAIKNISEGLPQDIGNKFNQVVDIFKNAVGNLSSVKGLNDGISKLTKAIQLVKSIGLPKDKQEAMTDFVNNVVAMSEEAKSAKSKSSVTPYEREKKRDFLWDKKDEAEKKLKDLKDLESYSRDMMDKLKDHPEVSDYRTFRDAVNKKKAELESALEDLKVKKPVTQTSLEKTDSEGDEAGNYADDAALQKWNDEQSQGDEDEGQGDKFGAGGDWKDEPDEHSDGYDDEPELHLGSHGSNDELPSEIEDNVPYKLNYKDNKKIGEASKNLLSYLNTKNSTDLVFGSKGKHSGLQGVATKVVDNILDEVDHPDYEGKTTKGAVAVDNMIESRPSDLSDVNNEVWDKISSADPRVIAKYATYASAYHPHPYSIKDVIDNKDGYFTDLIHNLYPGSEDEKLTPKNMKKIIGSNGDALINVLHRMGDKIVETEYKKNTPQREVLDKIRKLNSPASPSSKDESPGDVRRRVGRQVDYLFGMHHKDVPSHPIFDSDVQGKEAEEKWLSKFGKHFEQYANKDEHDYGEQNEPENKPEELVDDLNAEEEYKPKKKRSHDDDDEDDAAAQWLKMHNKSFVIYELAQPRVVIKLGR
jgi:hypothetical protein